MSEYPTIYSATHPTARKQHKCCECHGEIPIGERYQNIAGLWDGDFSTYKTCADCESLRSDIESVIIHLDDSPCYGGLCEYIFDEGDGWKMRKFVEIRQKRNAMPSRKAWMEARIAELDKAETP